jgi:hypothetical protein
VIQPAAKAMLIGLLFAGCPKVFYPGTPPCESDEDCLSSKLGSEFDEYVCYEERCTPELNVPQPDAGPDAGPPEAGFLDSGVADTGPLADTGPADSGVPADTGPIDSGPPSENLAGFGACTDGQDNDNDGDTDCDDSDCTGLPFCAEEICDNGWDDNANDLTDCNDLVCADHPHCQPRVTICDLYDAGYFTNCSNCHVDQFDQQGNVSQVASGNYRIDHSSAQALYDSLIEPGLQNRTMIRSGQPTESFLYAKLAGAMADFAPACAVDDIACRNARGQRMPRSGTPLDEQAMAAVSRWISGSDLQRCLEGFPVEDCQDRADNDGDGRIDCDDLDCRTHILCGEPKTICDIAQAGVFLPCINCHVSDGQGGLRISLTEPLTLYNSLVGVQSTIGLPLIQPGDHASSYLYLKMSGEHQNVQGGDGEAMPQAGSPTPQEHLDMLRSWIDNETGLRNCLPEVAP